jgi:CO/xanthine dehydrogenase FAD-binding subunit
MMNTHILSSEFEYVEAKTAEEAASLLHAHGGRARAIAGGTDLLVEMKMEKIRPEVLVNILRIPGLRYLSQESGLRIGALTSFRDLERTKSIAEKYTALAEASRSVSSAQIKTMGTIGGNLCHGSPAADSAPPLIVFGATVKLMSMDHERILSVEDFFRGPGETVLSPGELLVEIQVPEPSGRVGSTFQKIARVSADLAKVSVAVAIERKGTLCKSCKIALGAVAKTPMRAKKAEAVLQGKRFGRESAEDAGLQASEEIFPITDIRSTAWYRKEVSRVMVRDALLRAWERAGVRS